MNHSGDCFSIGEKTMKALCRAPRSTTSCQLVARRQAGSLSYKIAALLCLVVINLFPALAGGQGVQPDERISLIRQRSNNIDRKLATYRIVKKNGIEIDSESGGKMQAYLAGNQVRKIVFRLNTESSRWHMEYYYWTGNLIFVYHKKVQMNMETMRPESAEEHRLYFEDGKIIKLLVDKADVSLTDAKYGEEYKSEVANTLRLSESLVALARPR